MKKVFFFTTGVGLAAVPFYVFSGYWRLPVWAFNWKYLLTSLCLSSAALLLGGFLLKPIAGLKNSFKYFFIAYFLGTLLTFYSPSPDWIRIGSTIGIMLIHLWMIAMIGSITRWIPEAQGKALVFNLGFPFGCFILSICNLTTFFLNFYS